MILFKLPKVGKQAKVFYGDRSQNSAYLGEGWILADHEGFFLGDNVLDLGCG